jgi:hypothetical protein
MAENQDRWIEQELERALRRVAAPEQLWDRIQSPEPVRSRVHTRFMALATVPMVMLVALIGSHTRNVPAVQFRSSDPAAIQAWVKSGTGLEVPMHAGKLAGASIVSARTAEIAYRGEGNMTLLVSARAAQSPRNSNVFSWTANGLTYQLACAEQQDLKTCALCHIGG